MKRLEFSSLCVGRGTERARERKRESHRIGTKFLICHQDDWYSWDYCQHPSTSDSISSILDSEETKRRLIQCIHRAIYTKDDANRSKSSDLFECRRASGRGRRWRHICTHRGQFDYCPEIIILSCSRRHHHHRLLRLRPSLERLRGHQTWCNRRVKRPISVQHTFIRLTSKMLADFSLSPFYSPTNICSSRERQTLLNWSNVFRWSKTG